MPEIIDPTEDRIGPHETQELIALTEDELDRRIWIDLLSEEHSELLLSLLRSSLASENAYTINRNSGPTDGLSFWREEILRFPGRLIVPHIYYIAGDVQKVRSFCLKINYCSKRAVYRKVVKDIKAGVALATLGASRVIADSEDLEEIILILNDLRAFVTDALLIKAIPVSVLYKIFLYSLEELCPCCKTCQGTGKFTGNVCPKCKGNGIQEPFVKPPV